MTRDPLPTPARSNPFGTRTHGQVRLPDDPFAARRAASVEATPEGEPYFALVASGPAVPTAEVERATRALEVVVRWGERDVLDVVHFDPPRPFHVGDVDAVGGTKPDFIVDLSAHGGRALELVTPEADGLRVRAPHGGTVERRRGELVETHAQLLGEGHLRASETVPGALELVLREGEVATVRLAGLTFDVRSVAAGFVAPPVLRTDRRLLGTIGGVAALVLGTGVALSALLPPASSLGGEGLDLDNRYVQALIEAAQQPVPPPAQTATEATVASDPAATPDAPPAPSSQPSAPRGGSAGPVSRGEGGGQTASDNAVVNAIALIAGTFQPTNYSNDSALTAGTADALAVLVGGGVGSNGSFGLLDGPGSGSNFRDGTLALNTALHTGDCGPRCGLGRDGLAGRIPGLSDRDAVRPRVLAPVGESNVQGGLTADQVRRVVQRNISQVQHCYEQGLQRDPSLAGRVTVAFIVSPTGAVMSSSAADGSLPDPGVRGCIAGAVRRWSFPQPETGGPVSVRFPFNLARSGS